MVENELQRKTRQAVEQMRQMNMRASLNGNQKTDNSSSSDTVSAKNNHQKSDNPKEPSYSVPKKGILFGKNANFPLSQLLIKDSDTVLIAGLLLILMSEKADKTLLFALIYILS